MPEVSAVLLECPKKYRSRSYQDNSESKHERKACEPQLMVNIRVNPSFHIEKLEKFLILDEVYDPRKRTKAKILSPYLIELSRGEPVMMYPLQFSKIIKLEDANNKECDEGAHHNMGNYMTDESGNNGNGNGNDGLNTGNNDKDEHGPEEAQCQHNEHTTKCDEMLESSGAQSTQSTYSSCKTSTERPSTCMPLTARPPNKCSTNQLSPEDESLNRVMQKIHQSFAPITKISENRPSGNIKQNHNSKIRIGDPTDFSEIFKRPHDQFDNPFSNTAKSDKYPNVWNKDRFMMHRPFNKKTKAKSKPPHNRVSAVSAIRSKQRKNLLQAKIFDDLSANVGVEKPFAKRLLGNKLAQLGIITSPRAERKVRKKGRVDDIKNAFEDEDDDDGSSTISKDSDYDKLLEKTSEDINNIDKDELPFRDSNTDEKEYRNAEERVDAILRDRKKTNENRKRFQVGRKHHRYRDEKLEEDTAGKANFKSCECKSAPRRGPEESNDRMELKNVEKCVNSQDLEEDNDFKEDPKVDMDENDLLSSSEMQVTNLSAIHSLLVYRKRKIGYVFFPPFREYQKGYWPGKYGEDHDKQKEREKDINFQQLKTHNEELYQPILYGNYFKNPTLMYSYQTAKSETAKITTTAINEDETTENFAPDFMQPTKVEFENMYKYPNAFRSMLPHARKIYSEYMETTTQADRDEDDLFTDKNLSVEDKMRVIDATTNIDDKIDFNGISAEMDKSASREATAFPYPLRKPKTKHKRSFLLYDDMEMPDNIEENQGVYDHLLPALNNGGQAIVVDDGVQPCATCGGKGRKPPPKSEPEQSSNEKYINCNCRNDPNAICMCDKKKRRAPTVRDAWYSVFNMSAPLPFLTTRLRIFRKRHGVWWRIVPSITLNSLSGIFANANLSILFSSHVDIFQFEKSLQLQNNQLLVPKDDRPTRDYNPSIASKYLNSADGSENLKNFHFNPENLLAVDPARLTSDVLQMDMVEFDKQRAKQMDLPSIKSNIRNTLWNGILDHIRPIRSSSYLPNTDNNNNNDGIKRIIDFGFFPTSLNVLEYCPNAKSQLCLNMLDDRVPELLLSAFTMKVKMLFRENSVIYYNISRVKIAKIVTDATTKDALQVAVDLVNEGMQAREFSICVCNCPTACASAAKTTVTKVLLPHIRETVTFLLPLIVEANNLKHRKFDCELIVRTISETPRIIEENLEILSPSFHKTLKENQTDGNVSSTVEKRFASVKLKQKIVAIRKLSVDPDNRCLCVWECKCHCVPKLETMVDFHICQELTQEEKRNAGLLQYADDLEISEPVEEVSSPPSKEHHHIHIPLPHRPHFPSFHIEYKGFLANAIFLLLIMILLGLIKAILGLCIKPINKSGYDYVQPARSYKRSSRLRRFCVNTFFFIVFPFLFWCKCFTPSEEDLLAASTEWPCSHEQSSDKPRMKAGKLHRAFTLGKDDDDDEEDVILSQHLDLQSLKSKPDTRMGGGYDVPSLHDVSDLDLAFDDDIFDDNGDDDDDEANTRFILKALAECRESLKRLHSDMSPNKVEALPVVPCARTRSAEQFVKKLKEAQIVYRTFSQPLGNMREIPSGFKYCIQGYFLPTIGTAYEFVNYNPLAQHRGLAADRRTMLTLRPPVLLCSKDFSRRYINKLDVLDAGDLSEQPPLGIPCINISAVASVATSMAKLASENCAESMIDQESISLSLPLSSKETSSTDAQSPYPLKDEDDLRNLLSSDLNLKNSCTSHDVEIMDDDANPVERAETVLVESNSLYSYDINTIPE
ncbi:uncharacterized protein ACN427_006525 [Glossina fuscipes fuscipes]